MAQVSFWVASEVIQHAQDGGMGAAVAVTVKFIDIAAVGPTQGSGRFGTLLTLWQELSLLNNFNTLAAVLAGLNLHSVERIKALWSKLPEADQERLEELNDIVAPKKNYSFYRGRIKEVYGGPALPYVAVYLRDLTFIEDGNGAVLSYRLSPRQDRSSASEAEGDVADVMDLIAPESVLNVEKTFLLGCSMYNLLRYQQVAYDLPINPQVMSYLLVVNGVDEETLYEKSVLVQPVGSNVATGIPTDEVTLDETTPTKWQPEEVGMWLRKTGMADLKQQFATVNGRSLLSMQSSDLERFGVAKLGTRVRLMKAIKELNEWSDPLELDAGADPSQARTLSNPMSRGEMRRVMSLSVGGALSGGGGGGGGGGTVTSDGGSGGGSNFGNGVGSGVVNGGSWGDEGGLVPRRRVNSKRRAISGRASRSTGNLVLNISSSPRSAKSRYQFLSLAPSSWTTSNCKRYIRLCPSLKCVQAKRLHRHSMRQLQVATAETLASWGITKEEDQQAVLQQFQAVMEEFRGLPLASKHLADWTEEEVVLFLALNGASEYESIFAQRRIDGKLLARLGSDEMEVLGVKSTHRLALVSALRRHCARVPS